MLQPPGVKPPSIGAALDPGPIARQFATHRFGAGFGKSEQGFKPIHGAIIRRVGPLPTKKATPQGRPQTADKPRHFAGFSLVWRDQCCRFQGKAGCCHLCGAGSATCFHHHSDALDVLGGSGEQALPFDAGEAAITGVAVAKELFWHRQMSAQRFPFVARRFACPNRSDDNCLRVHEHRPRHGVSGFSCPLDWSCRTPVAGNSDKWPDRIYSADGPAGRWCIVQSLPLRAKVGIGFAIIDVLAFSPHAFAA